MHKIYKPAPPPDVREIIDNLDANLTARIQISSEEEKRDIAGRHWSNKRKEIRELRKNLLDIYGGCCCFCESANANTIDHIKPKRKYPQWTYKWDNLHLCCSQCNSNKGDREDAENPILDPCKDSPSSHLKYSPFNGKMKEITDRGQTTINLCGLNRKGLEIARSKVFGLGINLIEVVKKSSDKNDSNKKVLSVIIELSGHGRSYCSVIRYIIKGNRYLFRGLDMSLWK